MPLLYKIFLFFLLKQGIGVVNDSPVNDTQTSVTFPSIPVSATLLLKGDPQALEEAIMICRLSMPDIVTKYFNSSIPESSNATIVFASLKEKYKDEICRNLYQRMAGRILVAWNND